MGVIMAVAAVVAFLGLRRGVQQAAAPETATETSAANVPGTTDLPGCWLAEPRCGDDIASS